MKKTMKKMKWKKNYKENKDDENKTKWNQKNDNENKIKPNKTKNNIKNKLI